MDCPKCKIRAACVDSATDGENTFRKYKCSCGEVFYTHEQVNVCAKFALNHLRDAQKSKNTEYKRRSAKVQKKNVSSPASKAQTGKGFSEKGIKSGKNPVFEDIMTGLRDALEYERGNLELKTETLSTDGGK